MKRMLWVLPLMLMLLAASACVLQLGNLPSVNTLPTLSSLPNIQATSAPPQPGAAPVTSGAALDPVTLYQRTNPGVVTIWLYDKPGSTNGDSVPFAQGSGFVIDADGHILTNRHVVDGADKIEVDFASGLKVWATLVATDADSDLAVLKVDVPAAQLTPLTLGDSDQVHAGDSVYAIGNPFSLLAGTMTHGIVSAIGRTLDSERAAPGGQPFTAGDIIQTDAAINPGNSGGPLLNDRGQVIGVNRAIRTETFTVAGDAANSGLGFAVPINIVKRVVPALIQSGKYDYPYLGISSLSDRAWNLKTIEELKLPTDIQGTYITCVTPGGPADKAGIIGAGPCDATGLNPGGDVILSIDGQPVHSFNDLLSYLVSKTQVGQVVTLTVLRGGKEVQVPLTLAARP
jgi:S1-C subfamily serine protease